VSVRENLFAAALLSVLLLGGCTTLPGKPATNSIPVQPNDVVDFASLYAQNCAGCHGINGKGGAAISLADPVYLAIADDSVIRRVTAEGVSGTSMPAFAQSAGGMLTDAQIDAVVRGIRTQWEKVGALNGQTAPPYAVAGAPGNAARGAEAYATFCASCHGQGGTGTTSASSIVDPAFLALVSDQGLRTTVIAGRADLGSPDWRNDVPGKPMSAQDVSDVVAWLGSHRTAYPGQPYPNSAQPTGERK
jgi:cytochrome c oxidase cbb3-type subunit III